ncbi:hypothetical protein PIB30_074165 [Stylosanthes scabra]|uniref:Uncharacterized protein n=1 Tax=Stylosanthes scabra TaxID=79078 RepID=A0ABU6XRQ6_9FABA|nr:hypothetical protein [Stylosanthes scabra]
MPRRGSARLGIGGMGMAYSEATLRRGLWCGLGLLREMGQGGVPTPRCGMSRLGVGWLSGRMLGEGVLWSGIGWGWLGGA